MRVRVLQLNLCGSGFAACYTGRSVAEAASLIRAEAPDLVTLNEVCAGDVSKMQRALADVVPGGTVTSAFRAARDARTGEAFRCRAGRQYGIGLVSRWPAVPGSVPGGGIYPIQDRRSPEGRAWLCLDVAATPALSACTTHLTHTEREVAGAQCRYLFETVMPQRRAQDGELPVVVGGDLNLGSGGGPDLSSCLPAGSALADDGGQQHVVATPEFVVESSRAIEMHETTDHPALLVTLALPEHRGSERVSADLRRRWSPADGDTEQVGSGDKTGAAGVAGRVGVPDGDEHAPQRAGPGLPAKPAAHCAVPSGGPEQDGTTVSRAIALPCLHPPGHEDPIGINRLGCGPCRGGHPSLLTLHRASERF
ncbi:endonuclease/exonuclease/phosphatase family protein [Pseudonocardia sp. DLS-67]